MNTQTAFGIGMFGIAALLGNAYIFSMRGPHINESRVYLEGTIKKESGSANRLVESSGASFGNESVKIGYPTYNLQIKTSEGVYTASVIPYGDKTLEALALAIEEGTKVRFPITSPCGWDRFGEDKIGNISSNELIVLGKE